MTAPTTRLHTALQGGPIPPDLIEPLRDLLNQLDHATGAADVAKRSAYCEATLTGVLDAFARLRVLRRWRAPADHSGIGGRAPDHRPGRSCCPGRPAPHSIEDGTVTARTPPSWKR